MKYKVLFVLGFILASCSFDKTEEKEIKKDPVVQDEGPKYTYKVYQLANVGWCYQVFRGSKMIINQKHIPAVSGVKGFETKEKAEIAVRFLMEKIENGDERPPVTPEELDSIGAITLNEVLPPPPAPPVPMETPPPAEEILEEVDY